MTNLIFGKNPIIEAIKSGKEINYVITSAKIPGHLLGLIKENGIPIKKTDNKNLTYMCKNANHQSIAAQIGAKKYSNIDEMLKLSKSKSQQPFLLILDKIQDPHNLGAIVRTAECMGLHGVITCKREAVSLTSVAEKASAGALSHVLVSRETNLAQTIDILKKKGFWIFGTDSDGINIDTIKNSVFAGPIVLIIGSEGFGISRLVKEKCDFILSIPMFGKVNSLNASVATGIFISKIIDRRQ